MSSRRSHRVDAPAEGRFVRVLEAETMKRARTCSQSHVGLHHRRRRGRHRLISLSGNRRPAPRLLQRPGAAATAPGRSHVVDAARHRVERWRSAMLEFYDLDARCSVLSLSLRGRVARSPWNDRLVGEKFGIEWQIAAAALSMLSRPSTTCASVNRSARCRRGRSRRGPARRRPSAGQHGSRRRNRYSDEAPPAPTKPDHHRTRIGCPPTSASRAFMILIRRPEWC